MSGIGELAMYGGRSSSAMKEGDRSFTIAGSGIGYEGGRYIISANEGPLQAARRAATKLFSKLKKPQFKAHANKTTIKFIMRETTSGAPNKTTRVYIAKRKLRSEPLERRDKASGKLLYTVLYDYDVKACNDGTDLA